MEHGRERAWLEINLDAIAHNYREITRRLDPGCQVIAVLKADAYGFGALAVGRELERLNCPMFGVVSIQEAMEFREHGIRTPVLVMGPVDPRHARLAADNAIELTAIGLQQAQELSDAAAASSIRPRVHIKLDVGLGRLGIPVKGRIADAVDEVEAIVGLPAIEAVALFTHFTSAEGPGAAEFNDAQMALFRETSARLDARRIRLSKHCSSTAPAVLHPEWNHDYIRVAALILGLQPPAYRPFDIRMALTLKTRVYQVKSVPAGTPVGYGPLYHALRDSVLAVVPIGYADGLRRSVINRGSMLVRGQLAPYAGKISSDYSVLDVTDIAGVQAGDVATVFGCDGASPTVYDYAALYPGTVGEVTTTITARVPRLYTRDED